MSKKHQKMTTWLVMLTLMWLLQISVMPLPAENTSEPARSVSAGQGPGYYEAIEQKAAPARKKSILPYVLIGVGALAVTAVVLFLVLKSSYDITGTWNFVFTQGSDSASGTFYFTGDKDSGTYQSDLSATFTGTYSVDDKKVTMIVIALPTIQFIGQFTGKDAMSGTYGLGSSNWNWTATRGAAAASPLPTPAGQAELLLK
ncbi:MAG TPA: hypothetical protein VLQ89_09330 [Candidatus Binatia bacterium]|nr:hypothetical protein [Candidatus Binatia bacterium]